MVMMAIMGLALLALSIVSVDLTLAHSLTERSQHKRFVVTQIAESALAQALARFKEAGINEPVSGNAAQPEWVAFSEGEYYYYTTTDVNDVKTIRAWGRVPLEPGAVASQEAPDSPDFVRTGWLLKGLEIIVSSTKYVPPSPLYFGNGGPEEPIGGFDWSASTDPADPSTWATVTSNPASWQASSVPFESNALDHPIDYLYNGGSPAPASTYPHPYHNFASQNTIGQFNVEAWFANSAGSGNDPTINVFPPPTNSYYDMSDPSSPDYAWPVVPDVPDVRSFSTELWTKYKDDPSTFKLDSSTHGGTFGDLSDPRVTFVTGKLHVKSGYVFRGAGVLVVRDDYDPNVDTDNQPGTKAYLQVDGTLEWTGLVVVSGWAPGIEIKSGGSATIVGALFGEDSVQSGAEVSLDSSTINLQVDDMLRVLYSNGLFAEGGPVHPLLPSVAKSIVGIRNLD